MIEESERVKYLLKYWSHLQLAREYEQLENIIKEIRKYGENCINNLLSNEQVENPYKFSLHLALEIHKNYLEILDKENK